MFLTVYYMTKTAAEEAVEYFKNNGPKEVNAKLVDDEEPLNEAINECFPMEQRTNYWKSKLLFASNFPKQTKQEKLKELFPEAATVILPRVREVKDLQSKELELLEGTAYLYFAQISDLEAALEKYTAAPVELDGFKLRLRRYQEPVALPQGLLKMSERKVVLRQGSKSMNKLKRARQSNRAKSISYFEYKLRNCISVINTDNKIREELALTLHRLNDLTRNPTLRLYSPNETFSIFHRVGVIKNTGPKLPRDNGKRKTQSANGGVGGSSVGKARSTTIKRQRPYNAPYRSGAYGGYRGDSTARNASLGMIYDIGQMLISQLTGPQMNPDMGYQSRRQQQSYNSGRWSGGQDQYNYQSSARQYNSAGGQMRMGNQYGGSQHYQSYSGYK